MYDALFEIDVGANWEILTASADAERVKTGIEMGILSSVIRRSLRKLKEKFIKCVTRKLI